MGGAVGPRGGFAASFLLALVVSGLAPSVTRGAEGAEILPGDPHAAVVADVDGDGVTDLVRIQSADARRHVVDVWTRGEGAWQRIGSTPIPILDASSGEERPVPGADASGVLVWHSDGRARVLVVARWGAPADDPPFPCCLSIFELVARDGDIALEPLAADGGMGEVVHAVDFDADGTDELVRTQTTDGDVATIEVLRWDGRAFRSVLAEQSAAWMWGTWVGDTDGHAGDDLLVGPTPEGDLRRLAWVDGRIAGEAARLDLEEPTGGWIGAIADGALVVTTPDELRIVRWPRGEQPATTARREGGSYPYPAVFGAGAGTLLAVSESTDMPDDWFEPVTIYDLALDRLGEVAAEPSAARIGLSLSPRMMSGRAVERYLWPYTGPFPAPSGDPARRLAWSGILLEAGTGRGYEARPIVPMLGLQPIGLAGPGDAWLVLSAGFTGGSGNVAYLYPGMVPPGTGRISVVPMDDVLAADRKAVSVEVRGAAVIGAPVEGVTELFAGTSGFEVAVTAPPGSWVQAWDGRTMHEPTVEQEPVIVAIAPSSTRRDENSPIRASLVVATPDGRATLVEWNGMFVQDGPELDVFGATDGLSFSATVRGVVGAHASVTIDGRAVDVDPAGGFATTVEAWPWPQGVEVIARDPIGNEAVERVEVIGLVDYRGLPWPLLGGLATVGAGATLFLRTPRLRSRAAPSFGDGRLEELDPIDGSSFDGR